MNTDYLAFEGVDGSGKKSYIEALSSHLEKKSINFKIVREPGGSKLGEGIRELLLSHEYTVEPLTEALLFSANRANLVREIIKPSIKNGIKINDVFSIAKNFKKINFLGKTEKIDSQVSKVRF